MSRDRTDRTCFHLDMGNKDTFRFLVWSARQMEEHSLV